VLLDRRTCDPLYRKALRVAVGATLRVPYAIVDELAEAVDLLRHHGFTTLALTPGPDAADLRSLTPPPRVALLLGSEGPGLQPPTLARADLRVRIPMHVGNDSLNVAATAAIALWAIGA
jgi:tRNA G18 (ribose-2'-O)-methylase SpoU